MLSVLDEDAVMEELAVELSEMQGVSVEECRSVYAECGNGDTVGSARALKPLRRRVACFVSRITTAIVKLSGV